MSRAVLEEARSLRDRAAVGRLPAAFARFADEPEQMPAGAPGKLGLLELEFAERAGVTRLARSFASGPQRVQRALYLDPCLPGMAFAVIQSVSGGVLQGDRLAIEVTARAGARAHITTQSATKLYRMERNYATQRITVRVEATAYAEFLVDYLIPYRGARLYQEIELCVAEGGTLLFWDALAPGRVAFGESFAYDLLVTRVRASDEAGALRFADTLVLDPARADPRRAGLLGDYRNLGTLYVLTDRADAATLADRLHDCLQGIEGLDGSASRLPRGDGAVARVRGTSMAPVQTACLHAWRVARELLLGVDAPPIHRLKYGSEPEVPGPPVVTRPAANGS
jgi:urease accessory protein